MNTANPGTGRRHSSVPNLQRLTAERDALAARLAEIEAQEPVAWVPIHPRTGPLWSMTTGSPDPERLPHYPLMPLYTCPAPDWKTAPRNLAVDLLAMTAEREAR